MPSLCQLFSVDCYTLTHHEAPCTRDILNTDKVKFLCPSLPYSDISRSYRHLMKEESNPLPFPIFPCCNLEESATCEAQI